jgi:hypothetical protein
MKKISTIVVLIMILSGCASATFTKTGDNTFAPRPVGCDFTIYTSNPAYSYKEVGIMEYTGNYFNGYTAGGPETVNQAKEVSANAICNSGGNGLLLWEANGFGKYKKATVVHVNK